MLITANTKISAIIKENPAAIEAIVSINKHFEKLRNPVLRKLLAPRVTIRDAAKIGGCEINDFYNKLIPLGFEIASENNSQLKIMESTRPDFMKSVSEENTTTLDVRPSLASGLDPFGLIMQTLSTMPRENTLLIINTFEPVPLINILKKKGFEHYTESKADNSILTYLKNTSDTSTDFINLKGPESGPANKFEKMLKLFEGRIAEVDVRHLEMPKPMVTILDALEKLPADKALFVHHKKVPQFLLPELQEKKYTWLIKEISEGDVKLLIYKE